jgi:phosphodiesterase/alkaline phosphatase D-like protein
MFRDPNDVAWLISTTTVKNKSSTPDNRRRLPSLPTTLPRWIAFGSCADQTEYHALTNAYNQIYHSQPDLLLLLGDNIYGDPTLNSLHQAYETFGAHPSVQQVLQRIPILPILDDNDYLLSSKSKDH